VSKTWSGNLAGGAMVDIIFEPITLTLGNHIFKTTVTVAEDNSPVNDEKIKNFEVRDCVLNDVLLQEDFEEDGLLSSCWENIIVSGATAWEFVSGEDNGQGNPANPQSGLYHARFQSDKFGNRARLITPPMNLINTSISQPVLTFWHTQAKQDGLRIYYKNALNASWIQIESFIDDIPSWKKETILLPEPSEIYWIAFEALSGGDAGVFLDNISIISADVSIEETQNDFVRIYPNPTDGILYVTCRDAMHCVSTTTAITNIEIFDVMGRKIQNSEIRNPKSVTVLDISHLTNGVYFIRITMENGMVTQKIVKL
jgi:hypothetical protein